MKTISIVCLSNEERDATMQSIAIDPCAELGCGECEMDCSDCPFYESATKLRLAQKEFLALIDKYTNVNEKIADYKGVQNE